MASTSPVLILRRRARLYAYERRWWMASTGGFFRREGVTKSPQDDPIAAPITAFNPVWPIRPFGSVGSYGSAPPNRCGDSPSTRSRSHSSSSLLPSIPLPFGPGVPLGPNLLALTPGTRAPSCFQLRVTSSWSSSPRFGPSPAEASTTAAHEPANEAPARPSSSLAKDPFPSMPLSFCVVGSGPAGFYTTDKLLRAFPSADVTLIDRLPSPFGLVRTGVAPDHPEVKFVTNQFTKVAQHARLSFFGHVTLGRDVSSAELRSLFNAVVLAYGAEDDKKLGIPGEHLRNCLSAREFVWWYNGHPEYVDLPVDLTNSDTAVLLGQGNVALDCARVLLRCHDELQVTDIAEHAMEQLRKSRVRKVVLVGRRGPAQAACTAKEVRELLGLKGVSVTADPAALVPSPEDLEEMKHNRGRRRVHELISRSLDPTSLPKGDSKQIQWLFFRSPREILPAVGTDTSGTEDSNPGTPTVGGVKLEVTRLEGGGDGLDQRAVGTGVLEEVDCGLVLRSIGYRSFPVHGLPFDARTGRVPNVHGRVLKSIESGNLENQGQAEQRNLQESESRGGSSDGKCEPGLYVVGWLKRGATGIIGTNEIDASDTVESILEDVATSGNGFKVSRVDGGPGLAALLECRGVRFVDFDDWLRIDWEEKRLGKDRGKQREKFVTVEQMLQLAGK